MSEATIKELEQLQSEKKKMLLEHETLKLKQREEQFMSELKEWKAQLKPRKQVTLIGVQHRSFLASKAGFTVDVT